MERLTIHSEGEMSALGQALAGELHAGDVIAMTGNLGAGKTALTKSIARGLGITEMVTSPTFTILQEYRGRLPLYHFDVYRIEEEEEMFELGYEDYFYGQGVCVVEWADRVKGLLPENTLHVEISYGAGPEERLVRIWRKEAEACGC